MHSLLYNMNIISVYVFNREYNNIRIHNDNSNTKIKYFKQTILEIFEFIVFVSSEL